MKITKILSHPCTYAVACTMLFAGSSLAETILFGQASIDGDVTISLTTVSFFDNSGTVPETFNIDTGSGSFAGLSSGSIMSLMGGPVTGNISVTDFATFQTATGLINFDLTHIDPGTGTLAGCSSDTVGNVCTTAGSPFTLTQEANGVSFTFSIEGLAYTGTSGTGESSAQGLFTGQQVPGTISEVLGTLATTGTFSNSYSASFSSETPEPGTAVMFVIGAGLMGVAILRGRRQPR